MRRFVAVLAVALLARSSPVSAQQVDVMAVVNRFVDALNKGDVKAAVATCAAQTAIIDEFAPYTWNGTGACTAWINAWAADAKTRGVTDPIVTLSAPRHFAAVGNRAYVVLPANYDFKEKGKPMKEAGALFTVALLKGATGWKITAWAWSTN